jgi:formylglycine-generating enzyme required for sulfatase activity
MKLRPADSPTVQAQSVHHEMVPITSGKVTLGLPRSGKTFGWDNEFEAHTVDVPSFEIDRYKVTNRQYLEFIAADGYENCAFWTADDWNWKETQGISHPAFWTKKDDCWYWRTMFDEILFHKVPLGEVPSDQASEELSSHDAPSALDWPVYVSQAEASAYAHWAGKSLPTEAEWQRTAYGTANTEQLRYPWGNEAPSAKFGNFDFQYWDPTPVNAFPDGQSSFGVHDLLGNGWEWTSTVFGPFPGFQPFPFYRGYSADFFDSKHFVMKGGSSRTAACMLRPSFRNWFQAHYQYVYAGFRCVRR